MPRDRSDSDHDASEPEQSADPFADLPPPPGSQPTPGPSSPGETSPSQPASASGEANRRRSSAEAFSGDVAHAPHETHLPSSGLVGALQWTVLFFHDVRPDLRRVIGVTVLVGAGSLVGGLFVAPVLGLGFLFYFPTVFLLTSFMIIATYDSIFGLERSDFQRFKWAVIRTPAVIAAGFVWYFVAWFGALAFFLPGIYLYVKGLLVGPAAVLDDGFALRPFLRSKVATHWNNRTVIGLFLVTLGGIGLLTAFVRSIAPVPPVVMAGERLTAQEIQLLLGVTLGFIVFPVLAPAYTWVYLRNRAD